MCASGKNLKRLTVLVLAVGSSACNIAPPEPPLVKGNDRTSRRKSDSQNPNQDSSQRNMDPQSWTKRLKALEDSAAKTAEDMTETQNQIVQLFAIRDSLCERQSELLNTCLVNTPLSPQNWRPSACVSQKKLWSNRIYTVQLKGMSGQFQLILDNSIESNVFDSEKVNPLQWFSRGSRNLRELKISDIGSFKLKSIGGTLGDIESATFTLKIDDFTLLTERDLLFSGKTETTILISQLPITQKLTTPECFVDENEIDYIVANAQAKVPLQKKIDAPQKKTELSTEENVKLFEDWLAETRRQYEAKSDIFLATAQDVGRLRRDLRGDLNSGCWGRSVIQSIEMSFKGAHLPLSDWDRSQTALPLGITGHPTQTTLDLGGGLRFTNPDEKTSPLFQENGKWVVAANTELTIGDISNITVQKGGYSYQNNKNCWSTWGGLGTACEWQNRESDRYRLDALAVKINGQLIYERDSLNFNFERTSLNWIEKELTSNPAYVDLMRRRDCYSSHNFQQGSSQ